MSDDTTAAEAAREAFFAKLADPPDNVAVEMAREAEEGAGEPDPKVESASTTATPPATTSRSSAARSADASKAAPDTAAPPASTADAVLAALKAGDLDAIADLTGADPADFDESSIKWAARNRREAGLRKDIEKVRSDARQILEHYEPIETQVEAFDAAGGRDWGPVRAIVEHVTGKPWAVAAAQLGLGSGGPAASAPSPAAERVLTEAVRDDVPDDHQVRQLPGLEQRVVRVLREHMDDHTGEPSISFRQAAARALRHARDEYARLAPIFGPAAPAAAPRGQAPERAETAAPGTRRKLTPDEFYARFDRAGK